MPVRPSPLPLLLFVAATSCAPAPGARNLRTELSVAVIPNAALEAGRMPSGSTAAVTVRGAEYAGRSRIRIPMTSPTVRLGATSGSLAQTRARLKPPGCEVFRTVYTAPAVDRDKRVRIEATDGNTLGSTEIVVHPASKTVTLSARAGDLITIDVLSVKRDADGDLCFRYRLREASAIVRLTEIRLDFATPMKVTSHDATTVRLGPPYSPGLVVMFGDSGRSLALTRKSSVPPGGSITILACGDVRSGGTANWRFGRPIRAWVSATTLGPG